MSEITTVGLDLAKRVVPLCAEDAAGHNGRRNPGASSILA